jgi:hypothetical protein
MALALLASVAWTMGGGPACDRPTLALAATADPPHATADIPHTVGDATHATGSPPSPRSPGAGGQRAPSAPPLTSGSSAQAGAGGGEEGGAGSPAGEADPLVSNGLASPLCKGALGGGELSGAGRRDCATSGFVAAPAPTGNYGIDVHIDTGVLGLGPGAFSSIVEDLFVTPVWMALVWAVHALVVMLEWCFTVDVLDSRAAGGVGSGLRNAQAAFTDPWLATVLSIGSILALYNGLIRRRVAETVGQALVMLAMIAGGMWVIADPTGTVGALGEWANRASLGTLAVAARGTPAGPGRVLGESMDTVFAAVIEVPWCYLEFGDVDWCRDPARLDPRLRAAALKLAAGELAWIGCKSSLEVFSTCAAPGSAQATALERSSELLREARSNGAIFLALPPNGPARNSINEPGSLLRTICQSSDATSCRGPTAAQAEFRTAAQTWSRVGGLLLIVAGVLGMMMLLGFIALRLLGAAIFSLLYLLLAPGMVLAPALGDSGRAVFRKWVAQLLGAVVSKLLFSFLLGVVLGVLAILASLQALGWWTQWLLMSAFVWGAFTRRHQALGVAEGAVGRQPSGNPRSLTRRVGDALAPPRRAIGAVRAVTSRLRRQAPSVQERQKLAQAGLERAKVGRQEQARRTLEHEHREASARAQAAPEIQRRLSGKRTQLERVRREHGKALAGGERRRAAELAHRGARIEGEIERDQDALNTARRVTSDGEQALRAGGGVYTRERLEQQDRFLQAQAALPASNRLRDRSESGPGDGKRRDYAALAGLAGYGRGEYERLDPRARRAARLEIDRELALRKELDETAGSLAASGETVRLGRREQRRAEKTFDSALQQRMRDGGHSMPALRREPSKLDPWRQAGRAERGPASDRSSVMRDAHEVAARRKRQLGRDRR